MSFDRTPNGRTISPIQKKGDPSDIRVICSNVFVFAFTRVAHIVTAEDKEAHADLLANTIAFTDADVILLQEMSGGIINYKGKDLDYDWHGRLWPRLDKLGYAQVPVKLERIPQTCIDAGCPVGVNYTPIAYKDDLLNLVDYGHKFYDTIAINPDAYLSASKSYTWALFEVKATGKRFVAISTHFTYHGDPVTANECRISDAKELIKCLDMLEEKYPGTPVVLMGDLNCPQNSEPYKIVAERFVNARDLAAVIHNGHLATCHRFGSFPNTGNPIDHALVSAEGFDMKLHQVMASKETVNMTDHLPVGIDFDLL